MVEVQTTWDFYPEMDQDEYAIWSKKKVQLHLKAKGFIEFKANRNLLGQPQVRATSVWESMADAAAFLESPDYREVFADGLDRLITNITIDFWGTSPMIPGPLRSENQR